MRRAVEWIAGLPARRRLAIALVLGGLSVLALPPLSLTVALVPALSGLVALAGTSRTGRQALAVGWWFGVGHFAGGFYWITHSFLVDAARHAWMAPIALGALVAGMALYPAIATWATWRAPLSGAGKVLVFAVAWTVVEWLRGHLFTGFPWNLTGTVWSESLAMMQVSAVAGVHGLGLLTAAITAMPAGLMAGRRRDGVALVAACVLLIGCWTYGALRLVPVPTTDVTLRVVQPNVDQKDKWLPETRNRIFGDLLTLGDGPLAKGGGKPDLVIWPETATPFLLEERVHARAAAGSLLDDGILITGTPRRTTGADGTPRLWNSALALDGKGDIVGRYDKAHLVPLGEYVPLIAWFGMTKLATGGIDYSPGPGGTVLWLPGLPSVAPLICYEVIFPHEVASGERPEWLLNITNDAWFGTSAGPHQHLAAARFRAVEQGLPLVRAANTGISAVIGPQGRVLARLGLGAKGVLDHHLPDSLAPTPYARFGDTIPMVLSLVLLALAALFRIRPDTV